MIFEWSDEKDRKLIEERGIGFAQVQVAMENGDFLVIEHTNKGKYPDQIMFCVFINAYAYAVPAVITENGYFLKTIIPNRKLTKQYLGGES